MSREFFPSDRQEGTEEGQAPDSLQESVLEDAKPVDPDLEGWLGLIEGEAIENRSDSKHWTETAPSADPASTGGDWLEAMEDDKSGGSASDDFTVPIVTTDSFIW